MGIVEFGAQFIAPKTVAARVAAVTARMERRKPRRTERTRSAPDV